MSFTDWNAGIPEEVTKPGPGFVCMSTTVDDLSYTPSAEEKHRDAQQVSITGRRSWKTLKGRGEAVWPPSLEALLLEALEAYKPNLSTFKATKNLGRFPMRNRFISDFIFERTEKRRTPKQVGSRLQQLRDTCRDERILHLISRRGSIDSDYISDYDSSQASPCPSPEPNDSYARHMSMHSSESSSPPQTYKMYPNAAPSQHRLSNYQTSEDENWQTMMPTNYEFPQHQTATYRENTFELAPTYAQQAPVASMSDPTYHQPRAVPASARYLMDAYGAPYQHVQHMQPNTWVQSAPTYNQGYTQGYH